MRGKSWDARNNGSYRGRRIFHEVSLGLRRLSGAKIPCSEIEFFKKNPSAQTFQRVRSRKPSEPLIFAVLRCKSPVFGLSRVLGLIGIFSSSAKFYS
jgi:hypothetical protein